MTQVKDIIAELEVIAPLHYQEGYDNAGLITGSPEMEVTGVMVCLDSTEAVLEEAMERGCNVVVAHHPIVFGGLKKITGKNYVERVVIKAIKNDIAIYAIHTNLDNVLYRGVNGRIAERLGLEEVKILLPKPGMSVGESGEVEVGAGVIGKLSAPWETSAFLERLKEVMQTNCVRHTPIVKTTINTVALCGGAGSFLLKHAKAQKADIYITGDFKYHEFFDAENEIIIADIGHYESEQFTINLLCEIISEKFSNFAVYCTKVNTNPVQYL